MTLSTMTVVSAWTDKAWLTPDAMNLRLSQITINLDELNSAGSSFGPFLDVRDYGGSADGTDDTVAVGAAASAAAALPLGGIVYIPPNTLYSRSSLSASDEVTYLDASRLFQGRNIVAWHKPVDVSGFISTQHAELIHHTIEVTGSHATLADLRVDGGFDIVAVGKQTGAVASSDGSGIDRVIVKGTYLEHRSGVSLDEVWGMEVAASLYGNGKFRTVKGIESVAQIASPSLGNFSGASGSGEITNAIGIVGVARINTSSNTGLLNSGIGVQGTVLHRGTSVVSTLRCFNGTLQNLGSGGVAVYQGLAFDGSLTGAGTISEIDYIVIPNAPTPTGLLTTVLGLRVDEQSSASNNRTAWVRGDLHVDAGKDVILDGSTTVWDSTVSRTRLTYNATDESMRLYAAKASVPAISTTSSVCSLSVGTLDLKTGAVRLSMATVADTGDMMDGQLAIVFAASGASLVYRSGATAYDLTSGASAAA